MTRLHPIRPAAASLVLLWAGIAYAQSAPDASGGNDAQAVQAQSSANTSGNAPDTTEDSVNQAQYVPALNGTGLISLVGIQKLHVLAAGTISGGYDSNPNNLGNGSAAALASFSPYVGLMAGTSKTQYILQYHPTFTQYSGYAGGSMELASAKILSNFNSRWSWNFGMNGAHGDDSVRLLAPSHSVAVGVVAGEGPSSGSYLPDAGTVTDVDGGFNLLYSLSPRDGLGFQIADSYNSYPSLNENGSVASATVNYTHLIKPTLGLVAYQQTSQYYGQLSCTTFGGGAGIRWQPREETIVSLRGGPQLDAPSCHNQQGFAYSASFSMKAGRRAQLYFISDRQPVTGYLGPGLWQNDVSGGYQRQFSFRNLVAVDAGYVQSSTLANASGYDGSFVDLSYSRAVGRSLSLSTRYRSFTGSLGTTAFSRNMVTMSVTFTPDSRTSSQ